MWPEDMVSTQKIYTNRNYPKARGRTTGTSTRYEGSWRLWFIPKLDMPDLPDHLSTEIGHVLLRKGEVFFAPRQGLQKLASEYTAIVTVFLLWSILYRRVRSGMASSKRGSIQVKCSSPSQRSRMASFSCRGVHRPSTAVIAEWCINNCRQMML